MIEGSTVKNAGTWLRTLIELGPRLGISASNQVVSSGANFLLGLYLVRVLAPAEFGLFGICMALCLLYAGFGNALFLTQMVLHLPEKQVSDRPSYAAAMFALVAAFCVATLTLAGLLYMLSALVGAPFDEARSLILATGFASVANLLKNYFVRLVFSTSQEHKALAVNLAWAAILGLGLFAAHAGGSLLDAASALWIFAAGNLAAAVLGLGIVRLPLKTVELARMRHVFLEAFVGGRWAMGGVSVTWLQSQSYMYVTAVLIGPAGVALANAARMLIAPFTFLLPALTQVIFPRLVEMSATDKNIMLRYGSLYSWALVGLGVLYLLVLGLGARYIIPLLIGDNYPYAQLLPVGAAWSLVLILQLSKDGASIVLQAIKEFRRLTLYNTITAIVALAATAAMVAPLGVSGAVFGVGVGEALLASMLWNRIKHERRHHSD